MSGWLSAGWYVRFSTGFLGVRSILLLVTLCMLIFTLFTNGQLNKSFCPSGFRIRLIDISSTKKHRIYFAPINKLRKNGSKIMI